MIASARTFPNCGSRKRGRPGYAASSVLEPFVCIAGHGGVDPGDRLLEHREPAAGESRRAQARNGSAAQYGCRTIPRDPATVDVAAGLFVRTLSNLQSIQLGFNREDVLLFRMNARQAGHQDPEIVTFYSDLQNRFSAIPGVLAATVSDCPLLGEGKSAGPLLPVGAQPARGEHPHLRAFR